MFNTCVGVRNHRAFLCTILFVYLAYGSLAVLGFMLVVYEDLFEETLKDKDADGVLSHDQRIEVGLDTAIVALVFVKFILYFCCSKKVSFGYQIFWVLLEIILVQVLATVNWSDWELNMGAFCLCLGTTILLYGFVFLTTQCKLAAYSMTLKEFM